MTPWEKLIEDDLDWRSEELASLKHQLLKQEPETVAYRSLLRAMWAMLYAHYEGFCKFAIGVYIEHIEKSAVERRHCKKELIVLSLEKEFRRFRGNVSSPRCYQFFTDSLRELLNRPVEFERDCRTSEFKMKGDSNLYPSLLSENCMDLCLDVDSVVVHELRLKFLVTRRNKIAHGRKEYVKTFDDYKEYADAASAVMVDLAITIVEAINKRHYLAPVPEFEI